MTIRRAQFSDAPRLIELMQQAYEKSKYIGRGKVDVTEAREILIGAMQRDGVKGPGGTHCMVYEAAAGEVEGFIIGMTERVYHVADKLRATDIFFYVSDEAPPLAAGALLKSFEGWATSNKRVIEITLGITDAIDEPERLAEAYEARGYMRCGLMLERRVDE